MIINQLEACLFQDLAPDVEAAITGAVAEIKKQRLLTREYIGALELERVRTGLMATPHGYKLVPDGSVQAVYARGVTPRAASHEDEF